MDFLGAINMNRDVATGGASITAGTTTLTSFGVDANGYDDGSGVAAFGGSAMGSITDNSSPDGGTIVGVWHLSTNSGNLIISGGADSLTTITINGTGYALTSGGPGSGGYTFTFEFVDGVTYGIALS